MLTADRPSTPTTTHLTRLEHSGLIRLAQLEPEVEYLFRHGLVQDAVYESLLRQDRRKLHRAVGEALERAYPDRLDALAGMLATHFAESGEDRRALEYYQRAGDHAYAQYALSEAIGFYGAALDIGLKMDAPPIDALKHMALRKGRAFELQGDYENALRTYERMEELATSANDQSVLLAALIAQAIIRSTPSTVFDSDKGIALGERGMQIATQLADRAAEARLLWTLALAYGFGRSEIETALDYAQRSAAISREVGLTEQLAYTLNDISNIYYTAGELDEAEAALVESIPLWRTLDNPPMLAFSLNLMSQIQLSRGNLAGVEQPATEALNICKAINNLEGACFSYGMAGAVAALRGRPDRGLAYLREMIEMVEQTDLVIPMAGIVRTLMGWIYVELNSPSHVRHELAELMSSYRFATMARAMQAQALIEMARLELAINDPGVAVQMLTQLVTSDHDFAGAGVDILLYAGMVQAEYEIHEGNLPAALEMIDSTIATFERVGALREVPDALLLKAKTLIALTREDQALDALTAALSKVRQIGNRMVEWRVLAALADLESRHNRAESAAQHRREGRALLDQIAATMIAEPDLHASLLARPEAISLMAESA